MNRTLSMIGAAMVAVTVFLFAVFILCDFIFGSYIVCMFLPIGYIMMAAGLHHECGKDRKVSANIGLVLAGVYTVLILLVYYAQTTTVRTEVLNDQASRVLNYQRGGLMFNYDLLGYGMMALSTFFLGLSIKAACRRDVWLRRLMLIHGAFFISCFIMPMTGVLRGMAGGETSRGGTIALVCWCAYFLPVGVLGFRHFGNDNTSQEDKS